MTDAVVVELKLLKECTALETLNLFNQVLAKAEELKQNIPFSNKLGILTVIFVHCSSPSILGMR